MAEGSEPTPQGGNPAPAGAPAAPAPQNSPAPPAPRQGPEMFSREYVHELREENKGWRLKAQEQEQAAKTAREEAEKARKEADDKVAQSESQARDRIIRAELKAVAVKAGIVDLDALQLADLSKVTLSEDGSVEGADEMIEALKEAKPYLFAGATSSDTNPRPKPADNEPKSVIGLSEDEYRAAKRAAGLRV